MASLFALQLAMDQCSICHQKCLNIREFEGLQLLLGWFFVLLHCQF